VQSIDDLRVKLVARISPVLAAVWPPQAPLVGFDISLSDKGVTLTAQYQGEQDLSHIAVGLITQELQDKLKLPTLVLKAHRVRSTGKHRARHRADAS
jgi:hypothetical protein